MDLRILARLAAVLGPVAAAAAVLAALARPAGPGLDARCTAALPQRFVASGAEVVVLGNSTAQRAVDPVLLAQGLRMRVVRSTVPSSTAPVWYATLKYAVLAQELRPALVIVAGTEDALTAVDPGGERGSRCLFELAGTEDPEIFHRTGRRGWFGALGFRARLRADAWRSGLVDALVGGPGVDDRVAYANLVAGGGVAQPVEAPPVEAAPVEATYVAPIVDLLTEAGVGVVFLRIPARPGEDVRARAGTFRYLRSRGVPWLGGLGTGLAAEHYLDRYHMAPEASATFTQELVDALVRLGLHRRGRGASPG